MTVQRGICLAAVSLSLLSSATGCVHRELLAFHDHGSKPLTAVVVDQKTNFLYWSTEEIIQYSCVEQGDKLACKRLCGGSTDLVCPTGVSVYGLVSASGSNLD
jgi:hypothetical protein